MEEKMTDESIMMFGKHKGEKLANVPSQYLLWAYDQPWCKGQLKAYIFENMDVLNADNAINNKKSFDYKNYFNKR